MTSSRVSSLAEDKNLEVGIKPTTEDLDTEFGGDEARRKLERGLLRKLDLRMSILIFIYILNYVRSEPLAYDTMTNLLLQVDRNNAG